MIDVHRIKALILDMDGVLWRGPKPIGDLPSIFQEISGLGLNVLLASNNASKSIATFHATLAGFGVQLREEQIINSGAVAAHYLKERHPDGGGVFVVGEGGLYETLEAAGFSTNGSQPVIAVVVGIDRDINYNKIAQAATLIRDGVPFIGTNPDRTFPAPEGLLPGAGSMIAAVEAASGRQPVIVGKPETEIFRVSLERLAIEPAEAVIVGDRIETDIVCGQRLGMQTALVLSGVSTREQAEKHTPEIDWIGQDLHAFLHDLKKMSQ